MRNINLGDTYRLLGDTKLWLVTGNGDGEYNLSQLNEYGWVDPECPTWYKNYVAPSVLFDTLSNEGFIYLGNVYENDAFVSQYI